MDEQAFQERFEGLMERISHLPLEHRQPLVEIAQSTQARRDRLRGSVSELQDSLDYLRLSVKYLVFDLEATRRENAYLRRLIEQANREPDRHHEGDGEHWDEGWEEAS